MKFSTREDINAPIENVFDLLCDFEIYERAAIRRGAQIRRVVDAGFAKPGTQWDASFKLRGKRRELQVELTTCDRPTELNFESEATGLTASTTLELMALAKNRTRITIGVDIRPQSLPARLLIQSLKLAKASLTKRFKKRAGEFGRWIEKRAG